jgi:predicted MFS family arabinose efflux permease
MYATLTRTKSGISSSAALLMCLGFGSAMAIGNRLLQKTKIEEKSVRSRLIITGFAQAFSSIFFAFFS